MSGWKSLLKKYDENGVGGKQGQTWISEMTALVCLSLRLREQMITIVLRRRQLHARKGSMALCLHKFCTESTLVQWKSNHVLNERKLLQPELSGWSNMFTRLLRRGLILACVESLYVSTTPMAASSVERELGTNDG